MSISFQTIQPFDNPNEGREKINSNFALINDGISGDTDSTSISGSGTTNYIPLWLNSTALTNSNIVQNQASGLTIYNSAGTNTVSIKYDGTVDGLGGFKTVDTITSRDNILSQRRQEGMLVYVKENTQYYQLTSGLTNSDWSNMNWSVPPSSVVSVSTVGTNSYSGTGTPTITGYTIGTIYLTTFSNSNTNTVTTIDIDSQGPLNIFKVTAESGSTTLDIGDIQTGITYYLTYDGTDNGMQFFLSNPSSTVPNTYTNLTPIPATLGGVLVGTTFSATTYQHVFDTLFYPTLTPNFTSFVMSAQSSTLEVGDSVSGGTRVFSWTTSNNSFIKANTIKIYSGNTFQISTPTSGMTNDGVESISGLTNLQKTSQSSFFWKVYGTRTNATTFSSTFTVSWLWRRMFGVSTATTITTSASVNSFSGTGALAATIAATYSFSGAGYKYVFVPTTFASPNLFKDTSTNLSVAMATSTDDPFFSGSSGSYSFGTTSVTNQFGITQNYRIYRTRNFLNGNISIIIS